ncbi:MAG: helicase-related protein [Alphaproteobacteria bacterium]
MAASDQASPRIIAVLGPTNTGKTHLAVERMLGHASGMIGLPLRLLAREIYDRAVERVGARAVALITGEEKLVPASPRYFVCTVEAMPLERQVAFLAVDEIQLAADAERGHVFTHRLMHARGLEETMFLGAETIRPLIRRLVPGVDLITRPRFSSLTYAGARKLARLPPRSAVVTFSAAEVYAVAEYLRRQRGGAAVVLGALSPRTRNAQVALYQAGEVDYMVATDAIGMGLNMDVNHVAFASLRKFDGRGERALAAAEVAQIAGRAGRHMNDGTFGTTADIGPLDADIVDAVESHRFRALEAINWRNTALRFTSLKALLRSLEEPPPAPGLARAPDADDYLALAALARDDEIAALAATPDAVRRLWEVCRIPDYRKLMADAHVRLLDRIYRHLMQGDGRLPDDWVARLVARHDRSEGDIDTLAARIAHIRTWTYVSHRTGWLADPAHWQERTRAIEDRLSDALHERLTQRFIDRRIAVLVRRMKHDGEIAASVAEDGAVEVEGHFIGRLEGFRFIADAASAPYEGKALWNAAKRALKGEIAKSAAALAGDGDDAFAVDERAQVLWRGRPVARLVAGPAPLKPRLEPGSSELLEGPASDKVRRRLDAWLAGYLRATVGPLLGADGAALSGPVRGLLFQLGEGLGAVPRRAVARQVQALDAEDRKALAARDVRLGREAVFVRGLLKPRCLAARALLWAVHAKHPQVPSAPDGARVSVVVDEALPEAFYAAVGYRVFGRRALRLDIVERVAATARRLARPGPFAPGADLLALAGCSADELDAVLVGLGYRRQAADGDDAVRYLAPERKRGRKPGRVPGRPKAADPASPFAKLADLRSGA